MRKAYKKTKSDSQNKNLRRKLSIRKRVIGSADRPRICATKTNSNMFVQVIDDSSSSTLFSVQTFGKNKIGEGCNIKSAETVGKEVAKKLLDSNLKQAVFDRNGRKYTGVIAALAQSIRESGIQI